MAKPMRLSQKQPKNMEFNMKKTKRANFQESKNKKLTDFANLFVLV